MKNFPTFKKNDHELLIVNKEKYLGTFITFDCSDDEDVTRQMRSIYSRDNACSRNCKHCSE